MKPKLADAFGHLFAAIEELTEAPLPDEDIPDASGRCRHAERTLAEWRQGLTCELPAGTHVGAEYQVVVPNERVRTYNPVAILVAASAKAGGNIAAALNALIDADVFRLSVMWSNLEVFAREEGLELTTVNRPLEPGEIGDIDAPMVGWYWKQGTPRVEAAGKEPFRKGGKK